MDTKKTKKPGNKRTPQQKYDDVQGGKNSEKDDQCSTTTQPRILLKAKNKSDDPQKPDIPAITIATKAGSAFKHDPGAQASKQHRTKQEILATVSMASSVPLVGAHGTVNVHAFEFLSESNTDFFVVGAIGPQVTGKSTILNLLATSSDEVKPLKGDGCFAVKDIFAQQDTSEFGEEIRMFITKDRIMLLECCPILANRGKKDFIISELDDIRRIIMLLSVCHVLIVMQEDYLNINFLRLLLCAEMMMPKHKTSLNPKIVFVKNKCNDLLVSASEKAIQETVYRQLFKDSSLDIFTNMYDVQQINMLYFPNFNDNSLFTDDGDRIAYIQKFRQQIFMTPKQNTIANVHDSLNEKMWSQIVTDVLEGHNNNYFLRRYENLKEKYNLHNHVNVVENAGKDKYFLNFVET